MASHLNPATAEFGTTNLVSESGDYLPAASWAQMAYNTGFNWYTVRHLCTQTTAITRTPDSGSESNKVYMAAGTYVVYASTYMDLEGATSEGTIRVAGTTIIAESGTQSGWYTGSATVIIDTTTWYDAQYIAVGTSGSKTTVKATDISFHRGSSL